MKKQSALIANNFATTLLSIEKDQEAIWRKLFVESRPHSDKLKRLLILDVPDCLDTTQEQYKAILDKATVKWLKDNKYISTVPKLAFGEHEKVKSYILLEFDDILPTTNPEYRDMVVSFTIICNLDYWELDDYKIRPFQIAGYIDGILNKTRLSGIGELNFLSANQIVFNEYLGGILLRYVATHGHEDQEHENALIPASPIDL